MKKKEKDHLKADPFVNFFEKTIAFFKNNRRQILAGTGIVALFAIILLAVFLYNNLSSAGENKVYAAAFHVRTAENMTIEK
jgi:hypothetical protein